MKVVSLLSRVLSTLILGQVLQGGAIVNAITISVCDVCTNPGPNMTPQELQQICQRCEETKTLVPALRQMEPMTTPTVEYVTITLTLVVEPMDRATPTPVIATPVRPTPVQTTPVVATPVQTTPVVATPVQTTPVVATPAQTTPVIATPVRPTPVQPTPVQTIPAAAPLETDLLQPQQNIRGELFKRRFDRR